MNKQRRIHLHIAFFLLYVYCSQALSAITLAGRVDQANSQVLVDIISTDVAGQTVSAVIPLTYWTVKSDGYSDYAQTLSDVSLPLSGSYVMSSNTLGGAGVSIQITGTVSSSGVIATLKFMPTMRNTLIDGKGTLNVNLLSSTINGVSVSGPANPLQVVFAFNPIAFPAPTAVNAVFSSGTVTVSWTRPANPPEQILSYTVSSSPGGFGCLMAFGSDTSCTVTGLQNNTEYTFTVTANYPDAKSPPSTPSNKVVFNPISIGTCGSGNNKSVATPPSSPAELCSSGSPTQPQFGYGNVYTWSCNGTYGGASQTCSTLPNYPEPNSTLSIVVGSIAEGLITSQPPGISCAAPTALTTACGPDSSFGCGTTCSYSFTTNQSVRLAATPLNGRKFKGWSGGCAGSKAACTVKLNKSKSVTAKFK